MTAINPAEVLDPVKAIFSAGERPDAPIPVVGRVRFVCSVTGWKDDRTFDNATHTDALAAADRLISATGDTHHVFYEGVCALSADDNERFVDLVMGS
jgi:hypothetical protein